MKFIFLLLCITILFIFKVNIFPQQFNLSFKNVTTDALGSQGNTNSAGSSWIDFNNDSLPDLFVLNDGTSSELYKNTGNGKFVKVSSGKPIEKAGGSGPSWGDFDNDGYNDLVAAKQYSNGNYIYRNNGKNVFPPLYKYSAEVIKGDSYHSAWADYDNDGFLDLFFANSTNLTSSAAQANFLLHNNRDFTFSKLTDGELVTDKYFTSCGNWCDYDNDGDVDLYVVSWNSPNKLYENNGNGTFSSVTSGSIVTDNYVSIACTWGDYNNDGYMDVFVSNGYPQESKNSLYKNNGDKTFTKITDGDIVNDLVTSWNSSWGDLNNDGYLDLVVVDFQHNNLIYMNNKDGSFTKEKNLPMFQSVATTSACVLGDYDNDGDLDIFLSNVISANELWQNNTESQNHWIEINCRGTESNASAIGARVKIKANIDGKSIWQMRDVSSTQGMRSSNLTVHFGISKAQLIDSLIVEWPSGQKTYLKNVAPDQILTIKEEVRPGFIRANFRTDTISGEKQLKVSFKDISIYNHSEPVTSWEWDFDNDGKTDSDVPNPEWTYSSDTAIKYSVSLKVTNAVKSDLAVKKNYIELSGIPPNAINHKTQLQIEEIYPNPFSSKTTINYEIKEKCRTIIKIYNSSGQKLKVILDQEDTPGFKKVEWHGEDSSGKIIKSGTYYLEISAGKIKKTFKVIKK